MRRYYRHSLVFGNIVHIYIPQGPEVRDTLNPLLVSPEQV